MRRGKRKKRWRGGGSEEEGGEGGCTTPCIWCTQSILCFVNHACGRNSNAYFLTILRILIKLSAWHGFHIRERAFNC